MSVMSPCTGEFYKRVNLLICTGEFHKRVNLLICTGEFHKRVNLLILMSGIMDEQSPIVTRRKM